MPSNGKKTKALPKKPKLPQKQLQKIWEKLTGKNVVDLRLLAATDGQPSNVIDGRSGRPLEKLKLVAVWDVPGSKVKHFTLTALGQKIVKFVPIPDRVSLEPPKRGKTKVRARA